MHAWERAACRMQNHVHQRSVQLTVRSMRIFRARELGNTPNSADSQSRPFVDHVTRHRYKTRGRYELRHSRIRQTITTYHSITTTPPSTHLPLHSTTSPDTVTTMSYLSILLITVAVLVGSATCGCKEIDRCCEAMQSDCRAKVFQQVAGKTKTRFCFCDEHCLVTGDCCDDFTSHCKSQ